MDNEEKHISQATTMVGQSKILFQEYIHPTKYNTEKN